MATSSTHVAIRAKCRLPGPLKGLMRPLHVEHVNIGWDGETATFLLGLRGLEDAKFNIAEPHYAFVTETPGVRAFVDDYLNYGALCFSKDDAERELFQFYMDPISTVARRSFCFSHRTSGRRRAGLSERDVMAGVVNPGRTRTGAATPFYTSATTSSILCRVLPTKRAAVWTAVSRVPERKMKIGVVQGHGTTATRRARGDV